MFPAIIISTPQSVFICVTQGKEILKQPFRNVPFNRKRLLNILYWLINAKYVRRSSFYGEVAICRPATLLKMDYFTRIWQRLY